MTKDVFKQTGEAVTILAKLDIQLSNSYSGDKNMDQPLKELRALVRTALDSLESHKVLTLLEAV